jgi:hypothetical protein
VPLADFARSAALSLKPLHKICDLDLVFDANLGDWHLHNTEPFLDSFHPFVFAERRQPLGHGLEE